MNKFPVVHCPKCKRDISKSYEDVCETMGYGGWYCAVCDLAVREEKTVYH